jgi:hypothetical protein
MNALSILGLLFALAPLTLSAADKPPAVYPEHGKVMAVRTLTTEETERVRTDSQGSTHGGGSYDVKSYVYRVETEDRFYELTAGRPGSLQVGDQVNFRIVKKRAYVRVGQKEKWYAITAIELKPQP